MTPEKFQPIWEDMLMNFLSRLSEKMMNNLSPRLDDRQWKQVKIERERFEKSLYYNLMGLLQGSTLEVE